MVVGVLALGFDGLASGFDGTLPVLGALAYLAVSAFLGVARRFDERMGLVDEESAGDAERGDDAERDVST